MLFAGCLSEDETPFSEAQSSHELATELADETQESIADLGNSLEDVEQQCADLKEEQGKLKEQVAQQSERPVILSSMVNPYPAR